MEKIIKHQNIIPLWETIIVDYESLISDYAQRKIREKAFQHKKEKEALKYKKGMFSIFCSGDIFGC